MSKEFGMAIKFFEQSQINRDTLTEVLKHIRQEAQGLYENDATEEADIFTMGMIVATSLIGCCFSPPIQLEEEDAEIH